MTGLKHSSISWRLSRLRQKPASPPIRPGTAENQRDGAAPSVAGLLADAEAVLLAGGIEKALTCLRNAALIKVGAPSLMSEADKIALLARRLLGRDTAVALALAKRAIDLDRRCMEAWMLAGVTQDRLGYRQSAKSAFTLVAQSPDATPDQTLQAASMLVRLGDQRLALKAAREAFGALGRPLAKVPQLLYIAQKTADWTLSDELTAQLRHAYRQGHFDAASETPRTHLNWCYDERWNVEVLRRYNAQTPPQASQAVPTPEPLTGRRLRVGYLSSDFRDHPMSRWVKGLFRHHDKSRIELFLYCSSRDDGSRIRREVLSFGEHVFRVWHLGDQAAADLIRSHRLDVLVDLNGPTRGQRPGILARRCAPVQIHYIGLPGTTGGRLVDYVVGDTYVMPPRVDKLYPEKLIRLAKTYQVNDYATGHRPAAPSRAEAGLPDGGLVLGMFNGIDKVNSEVWAAWMAILKQVPNAVLWLLDPGSAAAGHIVQATEAHGVDRRRILMAPRLPQEAHLARLSLCDLMLDPWPYGGHTTTSDALFAGVPVLALEGRNFASRVSGSLLNAAGLPELVARSVEGYIDLAVRLLGDPRERERLQRHIGDTVPASDLFDTKSKARQLEDAYHAAVQQVLDTKPPMSIDAVQCRTRVNPA